MQATGVSERVQKQEAPQLPLLPSGRLWWSGLAELGAGRGWQGRAEVSTSLSELPPLGGQQADFLEEVSHCWSRKAMTYGPESACVCRCPSLAQPRQRHPREGFGGTWLEGWEEQWAKAPTKPSISPCGWPSRGRSQTPLGGFGLLSVFWA